MHSWMIYGASGYAGKLIAEQAKRRGLLPVLAGRNAREIEQLGSQLGLATATFDLADPSLLAQRLRGTALVLNCAGPFAATAEPMLAGCMRVGGHYLDITGEISVFEAIHRRADEIRRAGIVAMPGVGFDVVPSDCLAAMLKRALPDATQLRLAFTSLGKVGPGTMKTMIEGLALGTQVRRDGAIVTAPVSVTTIPFANGSRQAIEIPWGDVSTAYRSTGIGNIEVYMQVSPALGALMRFALLAPVHEVLRTARVQSLLKRVVGRVVKGPTASERARGEQHLWGEVINGAGQRVTMQLRTPGAYALTADAALASVRGVLEKGIPPGVYTPSGAFGADFVLELPEVALE